MIDGPTATRVEARDAAPPGNDLDVAQVGADGFAVDRTSGSMRHLEAATFEVGPTIEIGTPGDSTLEARANDAAVWVISQQSSVVRRFDPATGAPIGGPQSFPGTVSSSVLTPDGTLWALDAESGLVRLFGVDGTASDRSLDVGTEAELVVVGETAVLVDPSSNATHVLDPRTGEVDRSVCLDIPADDDLRLAGASADSGPQLVVAVLSSRGIAQLIDLETNDCRPVTLPGPSVPQRFGAPVVHGTRVFVPDHVEGNVVVIDVTPRGDDLVGPVELGLAGTAFRLFDHHSFVWYDDRNSDIAGVIYDDLTALEVSKTQGNGEPRDPHDDSADEPAEERVQVLCVPIPARQQVGRRVRLNGQVVPPALDQTPTFRWTIDEADPSSAEGAQVDVTWSSPGTYVVSVEVTLSDPPIVQSGTCNVQVDALPPPIPTTTLAPSAPPPSPPPNATNPPPATSLNPGTSVVPGTSLAAEGQSTTAPSPSGAPAPAPASPRTTRAPIAPVPDPETTPPTTPATAPTTPTPTTATTTEPPTPAPTTGTTGPPAPRRLSLGPVVGVTPNEVGGLCCVFEVGLSQNAEVVGVQDRELNDVAFVQLDVPGEDFAVDGLGIAVSGDGCASLTAVEAPFIIGFARTRVQAYETRFLFDDRCRGIFHEEVFRTGGSYSSDWDIALSFTGRFAAIVVSTADGLPSQVLRIDTVFGPGSALPMPYTGSYFDIAGDMGLAISDDGNSVAATISGYEPGYDYQTNVVVWDVPSGVVSLVTPNDAAGAVAYPSISGDGRLVTFTSSRPLTGTESGSGPWIYVVDRASGALRLISAGDQSAYDSSISRHGSRIAYVVDGAGCDFDPRYLRELSWTCSSERIDVAHGLSADFTAPFPVETVTLALDNQPAGGYHVRPKISGNGEWVAWVSNAGHQLVGPLYPGIDHENVFVRQIV